MLRGKKIYFTFAALLLLNIFVSPSSGSVNFIYPEVGTYTLKGSIRSGEWVRTGEGLWSGILLSFRVKFKSGGDLHHFEVRGFHREQNSEEYFLKVNPEESKGISAKIIVHGFPERPPTLLFLQSMNVLTSNVRVGMEASQFRINQRQKAGRLFIDFDANRRPVLHVYFNTDSDERPQQPSGSTQGGTPSNGDITVDSKPEVDWLDRSILVMDQPKLKNKLIEEREKTAIMDGRSLTALYDAQRRYFLTLISFAEALNLSDRAQKEKVILKEAESLLSDFINGLSIKVTQLEEFGKNIDSQEAGGIQKVVFPSLSIPITYYKDIDVLDNGQQAFSDLEAELKNGALSKYGAIVLGIAKEEFPDKKEELQDLLSDTTLKVTIVAQKKAVFVCSESGSPKYRRCFMSAVLNVEPDLIQQGKSRPFADANNRSSDIYELSNLSNLAAPEGANICITAGSGGKQENDEYNDLREDIETLHSMISKDLFNENIAGFIQRLGGGRSHREAVFNMKSALDDSKMSLQDTKQQIVDRLATVEDDFNGDELDKLQKKVLDTRNDYLKSLSDLKLNVVLECMGADKKELSGAAFIEGLRLASAKLQEILTEMTGGSVKGDVANMISEHVKIDPCACLPVGSGYLAVARAEYQLKEQADVGAYLDDYQLKRKLGAIKIRDLEDGRVEISDALSGWSCLHIGFEKNRGSSLEMAEQLLRIENERTGMGWRLPDKEAVETLLGGFGLVVKSAVKNLETSAPYWTRMNRAGRPLGLCLGGKDDCKNFEGGVKEVQATNALAVIFMRRDRN